MTEKLYYEDSYIKEFDATVTGCHECDGGYEITLDRTAFFPEEGGQYADTGKISGIEVLAVREDSGEIYHKISVPITKGAAVHGKINFDARFEKMQCHTAEHILSGILHTLYGVDNVGFHLGGEDVTLDISTPLTWEQLIRAEELVNRAIFENIEVIAVYPTAEELSSLEYRSKLDITENVRIINIGDYDSCACCAPHVKRTGECGSMKILDCEKLRGGMRIHITVGIRAYRTYLKMYENLSEISHALSVPRLDTAVAVGKLASDFESLKNAYKHARLSYFEREAELIESTDKNLVLCYDNATHDELRAIANSAAGKVAGLLVLLSGSDGEYKYIISSQSVDLRSECKKINAALCGRGGGSQSMVQGSFAASLSDIKEYFI